MTFTVTTNQLNTYERFCRAMFERRSLKPQLRELWKNEGIMEEWRLVFQCGF